MITANKSYRIIALTLAALMFFTSVGFSIDLHICQGRIKSFGLFGKAKSCYELANGEAAMSCTQQSQKDLQHPSAENFDKKHCCQSALIEVKNTNTQQHIPVSEYSTSKPHQLFVAAFILTTFFDLFDQPEVVIISDYYPPVISRDIPALFQSFLI